MSGRKRNRERERKRRREDHGNHSSSNGNASRHGQHSNGRSSNDHSLDSNNEELRGADEYSNRHPQQHQRRYNHNQHHTHHQTHHRPHHHSHHHNRHSTNSRQPISNSSSQSTSGSELSTVAAASELVVREIPGFYYDPEKKKYFKITANHVLGSQHPFSQQSIKQKTEQKPVLDPIKKQLKRRPYSALSHYGCFITLLQDSQLGIAGHPRRRLCDTHALLAKSWQKSQRLSRQLPIDDDSTYTQLQIDHARQDLYLGSSLDLLLLKHDSTCPSDYRHQWTMLGEGGSEMTSLHLTSDDYVVTTHLGNMGRSGMLNCYKRPELIDCFEYRGAAYTYSPQKSSIWSSSVEGDEIIIGADQKAIHFKGWKSGRPLVHSLWVGSDIFSTAIDPPEKRNLVYVGCRNGNVRVFDLNQPNVFSSATEQGKKKRTISLLSGIGHVESSVHCMRRVSEHYLVTAAMNGEISMWDTRFIETNTSFSKPNPFAKPMLSIRGSIHNYSTKTRFDINEEETLLASANIEGQLSIWSLRTGDRIRDLDVGGIASCVRFSKDQGGIWTAVGDQLQYWGGINHSGEN